LFAFVSAKYAAVKAVQRTPVSVSNSSMPPKTCISESEKKRQNKTKTKEKQAFVDCEQQIKTCQTLTKRFYLNSPKTAFCQQSKQLEEYGVTFP